MDQDRLHGQEFNALHPNDVEMQQYDAHSPDSDYFSEGERDSPIDVDENNLPIDPIDFSVSEDWIELDLSRNSPLSLGFLSGTFGIHIFFKFSIVRFFSSFKQMAISKPF